MNLDEELRAALSQEAQMRTTPAPDIERLVRGGQVRRRRRTVSRIAIAAVAVVATGGAAYGIAQIGSDDAGSQPRIVDHPSEGSVPETAQPWVDRNGGPATPGTYRKLVGTDDAGTTIAADLTVDGVGWAQVAEPVVSDGVNYAGLAIYRPTGLARGSGCESDGLNTNVSQTPAGLAAQLARLPGAEVVQPAEQTSAFGLDAIHVRVRINDQCSRTDGYLLAETASGGHGVSYKEPPAVGIVDFWVVDVRSVPVVIETFRYADTPRTLLDQVARARDSITFAVD
jgi:hypothetical protein